MTYTETKLEAIKILGKKDLTFGCIVSQGWDEYQIFNFSDRFKNARYWDNEEEEAMMIMNWGYKILWHIPHLEDLFRVAEEKKLNISLEMEYDGTHALYISWWDDDGDTTIPYSPTLPLLDQPSLPDILNLFK